MKKNCVVCSKEFTVENYKKDTAKYCSQRCQHKALERREARTCPSCGKIFVVRPSSQVKFCSKECFGQSEIGERNHAWEGGPVTKTCPICQKQFIVPKKSYDKTYCSKACRCKGFAEKRIRTEKRVCEHCQKEFMIRPSAKSKFCSLKCYHAEYRAHPEKFSIKMQESPRITFICKVCGITFSRTPSSSKLYTPECCSNLCKGKYIKEIGRYKLDKNGRWLGGKSFEPYTLEFTRELREVVRARDKHTCLICGKKQGKRKHSVHHADYNKANNDLKNLFTTCVKCHSKTNVDREKWQEYFTLCYM
jgi:hypothetical protein